MKLVKKPLTKLDKKTTQRLYQQVKEAEKRDQSFFETCEKNAKWLKGDQWEGHHYDKKNPLTRREPRITVNLAHAHVRSIVPMLFFKEPNVKTWPLNQNQEGSAAAWESLINAFLVRSGYKDQTKEVIMDSVVYPEGWKKWVVYGSEGGEVDELESFADMDSKGPGFWQDKFSLVGTRVCPTQIITDAKSRKPEDCRFIAVKYRKLLEELLADERYKNGHAALKKKFMFDEQPMRPSGDAIGHHGQDVEDHTVLASDDEMVDIYEVWVYQHVGLDLYKQVIVLAEELDVPLRGPVNWEELVGPYLHTYPFTKIELNPIPDDRPQSELSVWYSLQASLNWVSSKVVSQVNNQKQLYLYNSKEFVSPKKAENQMHSSNAQEFIEVKADLERPPLVPVQKNHVSNDDWNLMSMLQQMIQQVTGVTQNRRGAATARTATEADIIEQAAQTKNEEKIEAVKSFLKQDIQVLIRLIRGFITQDIVFRLTGNVGPVNWGEFTREDAAWSPDVEIEPESFRRTSNTERIQAYQTMLNAGGMLAQMGYGGQIRMDVIYRRMLEEFELPNPQEITNDNVPGEVKQMAEIVQMVLGLPAEVLPTDNHKAEMAALESFINSEIFGALPPEVQQTIEEHYMLHEQMLQQTQQASNGSPQTGNTFDDSVIRNGNPASEARQETQGTRGQF